MFGRVKKVVIRWSEVYLMWLTSASNKTPSNAIQGKNFLGIVGDGRERHEHPI